MSDAYNDGGIPANGFSADIKRGASTAVGTYLIEGFTPDRPGVLVTRPNVVGGPNGFCLNGGQPTGSGTLQIATTTTETPKIGDWFTHTFDRGTGGASETWVITRVSDPWELGQYAKCSFSAILKTQS